MREWHQHAKTHTVALSIRAPRTNISLRDVCRFGFCHRGFWGFLDKAPRRCTGVSAPRTNISLRGVSS